MKVINYFFTKDKVYIGTDKKKYGKELSLELIKISKILEKYNLKNEFVTIIFNKEDIILKGILYSLNDDDSKEIDNLLIRMVNKEPSLID